MLRDDAQLSERITTCRRRGTLARAVRIVDGEIVATQYSVNGLPTCKAVEGGCGCIHAEQRLIIKLLRSQVVGDLTMLTTLEPCESCANLIVESGLFSAVYFLRDYRSMVGRTILESAGIKAIQL